jgi:exodeoxyribonuclease VII small subunit
MSFEDMIKRLEEITQKLESGECGLDDASLLFDEAKELSKKCYEKLDINKGKITEIVNELDGYVEKLVK